MYRHLNFLAPFLFGIMLDVILKLTTIFAIILGTVILGLSAITVYWINRKAISTFKIHSRQLQALSKRLAERNLNDHCLAKLAGITKMTVNEMKEEREEGTNKQPQIVQEIDDKVPDDKYTKAQTDDDNYKTLAMLPEVFSTETDVKPTVTKLTSISTAPFPLAVPSPSAAPPPVVTMPQTKNADDGHYENI